MYAQRIETLRSLMQERGWDAVVITGSDPFGSEYPAQRWQQVRWLTGFTGEAGDVVVTANHAGLWTDTRYFIQAVSQLEGTGAVLHKTRVPDQVLIPEWLSEQFADTDNEATPVIAIDGLCVTPDFAKSLPGRVESVPDLLSELWEDRPDVPQTPIMTVDSGESRESKIDWLKEWMTDQGYGAMLLTGLDDIAWLLNVRAMDIEYNPLVISYLLITETGNFWFVKKIGEDEDAGTAAAFTELDAAVEMMPFDGAVERIAQICAGKDVALDSRTVSFELFSALESSAQVRLVDSPVQLRKAVKNPTEIEGMRHFHILDGIAMEKFLWWLEKSLAADRQISEWDAAVKLGQLRAEIDGYVCDSFCTISAIGKGAALPHYSTPNTDAPLLRAEGLYLCDSGGQYCDGQYLATTDITRTVPLGPISDLEREDYTLVMKGHVDLAMAIFPRGTAGCQIDALAREPLWRYRRLFGHGTGHGVGSFLGCHEGPADMRQNFNRQPLLPGMILSDEPGIYREGMHGVRHENLLLVVTDSENEFGSWLRFEPLSMCHFDTSALDVELLTKDEKDYINDYNNKVCQTLTPYLPEEVAQWLAEKTEAI